MNRKGLLFLKCLERPTRAGCRVPAILGGCAAFLMSTLGAQAQIFDFQNILNDSDVTGLPLLGEFDQATADAINNSPSGIKAAKVGDTLTTDQAAAWFNAVDFDYVFADFEGLLSASKTLNLVEQAPVGVGVGNFALDPLFPDSTQSNPATGFTEAAYALTGVTISNSKLYPGSPSLRNPASGNSTAPNVRSALFTLPITQLSEVEAKRGETIELFNTPQDLFPNDHKNIPYVTRFNNYGNNDLNNTDEAGSQFPFQYKTDDQLLARGDFAAMVSHYRLRGADGVVLFQPGVIGYSKGQMRDDALEGWELVDPILDLPGGEVGVTIDTTVNVDGSDVSLEDSGVVWSGASSDSALAILLSNLDEVGHEVALPDVIEGFGFNADDNVQQIEAGQHLLLEFVNDGRGWAKVQVNPVFTDDDRSGIGVPEPASLVMLAIGSVLIGLPRSGRRR